MQLSLFLHFVVQYECLVIIIISLLLKKIVQIARCQMWYTYCLDQICIKDSYKHFSVNARNNNNYSCFVFYSWKVELNELSGQSSNGR